jgi:hypothetical protein
MCLATVGCDLVEWIQISQDRVQLLNFWERCNEHSVNKIAELLNQEGLENLNVMHF